MTLFTAFRFGFARVGSKIQEQRAMQVKHIVWINLETAKKAGFHLDV